MDRKPRTLNKNSMDMLHGPLVGKILAFAIPLALSSLLQQLFTSADAAIAGRFVNSQALAAIGGVVPITTMFINFFVGLSIGANVVVAIRIGQKDTERIGSAVHTAIAVALVSGAVLLELIGNTYETPAGAMRGMGWSTLPAMITIVGSCVLRIVYILTLFPLLESFEALVDIYPVTWSVTGAAMLVCFFFVRKRCYAEARARGARV